MNYDESIRKEEVKVAFLPVYQNPYQSQLENALKLEGVSVKNVNSLPSIRWLIKWRKDIQILHFHWLYGLYMWRYLSPLKWTYFLLWFRMAMWLDYRIVWTAHNIIPHNMPFPLMHLAIRRLIMKEADVVIAHCDYGKKELLKRFPRSKPIEVVPIGSYEGVYPNVIGRNEARKRLNIDSDKFVYLFLGNISQYKGLKAFTAVFQEMATESDLAIIAGRNRGAALVDELVKMAKADERIRIHADFIPDDEMQNFLRAADVMVAPFEKILTSSSVMVGLSFGLPVIVPDLGCLPELITSDSGIVYPANDREGLKQALTQIKERDLSVMRLSAREISSNLQWEEIGQQTANIYRSILI